MGFSNQERINMDSKAILASVLDANPTAQWYETRQTYGLTVASEQVWLLLPTLLRYPATTLAAARTNVTDNLDGIVEDVSQNADAIRLSVSGGSSNSTYVALSVYNDFTSTRLKNWLQPQQILTSTGAFSNGYSLILYEGQPGAGGTIVPTTDGSSGSGETATVGWIWNYSQGLLLLSDDFKSNITDPWIVGFRYIGLTAGTATVIEKIADETIAMGEIVRLVTSSDVGLTAGRVIRARANTAANGRPCGVALANAIQGSAVQLAVNGSANVLFSVAPAVSDIGKTLYLSSSSAGAVTFTAPVSQNTVVVEIGKLLVGDGSLTKLEVSLSLNFIMQIG